LHGQDSGDGAQAQRQGRVCEKRKGFDRPCRTEWRREAVADHLRLEQCQCQAVDTHPQVEKQAEEGDVNHRLSFTRARRPETKGTRSGMRHGSAAIGLLAESPATTAPPRRARTIEPKSECDSTVRNLDWPYRKLFEGGSLPNEHLDQDIRNFSRSLRSNDAEFAD